jgi:hypothetical protein
MKLSEPGVGTFPELLKSNYGMQSSLLFKRQVFQVAPPAATYTDWWFMLCAAYAGNVSYVPDDLALYRMHSQNLTAAWRYDHSPQITTREHTRSMGVKLAAARHFDLSKFSPHDALTAWQGAEDDMWNTWQRTGTLFNELTRISDDDREVSATWVERADAAADEEDHAAEAIFLWKALAWNPYGVGLKARLVAVAAAAAQAERYPHPLEGAKDFVVLADAVELLAEPALLAAYADAFAGSDDVTLAIDATDRSEQEAGEDLHKLIVAAGLESRDDLDVLGVVGVLDAPQRYRMLRGVHARLRPVAGAPQGRIELPEFDAATLADLRELAAERRTVTAAAL